MDEEEKTQLRGILKQVEDLELTVYREHGGDVEQDELAMIRQDLRTMLGVDPIRFLKDEAIDEMATQAHDMGELVRHMQSLGWRQVEGENGITVEHDDGHNVYTSWLEAAKACVTVASEF